MTDTTPDTPTVLELPLDEQYDTQMEVERDPCGAWMAIQTLSARLAECEAALDSDPHGSGLWRYWSSKSCEISQRNVQLLDRATTAEVALAEARKVIEPFSKRAGKLDGLWKDHETHWPPAYGSTGITIGNLKAASRWLSANPAKETT